MPPEYVRPPTPNEGEEPDEQDEPIGHWEERLTSFQKLILVKNFKEEKVLLSIFMPNHEFEYFRHVFLNALKEKVEVRHY